MSAYSPCSGRPEACTSEACPSLANMDEHPLHLHIGPEELVVRQRYETLSTANDFLAGVTFVVGSVLFFFESTTYAATWFFLVGSILFVLRPTIRLTRRIHLRRWHAGEVAVSHETPMDF